jgi:glucose uptake protein GlcU
MVKWPFLLFGVILKYCGFFLLGFSLHRVIALHQYHYTIFAVISLLLVIIGIRMMRDSVR